MKIFKGTGVSAGIAIGKTLLVKKTEQQINRVTADNPDVEWKRFLSARDNAVRRIENLRDRNPELFDAHCEIATDPDFCDAIHEYVFTCGNNAEYAVYSAGEQFAAVFESMDGEYMQKRGEDVRDVASGIIDEMSAASCENLSDFEGPHILIGTDFFPSETAKMSKQNVIGFATEKGTVLGHTAILARMMSIPAVVNIGDIDIYEVDGRTTIIDGEEGLLIVEPDEVTLKKYNGLIIDSIKEKDSLADFKGRSTQTSYGQKIRLFCNVSSPEGVEDVIENDGEGIGLFRSEFLFLKRDSEPDEDEQFAAYKSVLQKMNGKDVIIRTLDIGADKQADYLNLKDEENPALGNRAIRLCLSRPELFRTQLRALYRASVYGNLSIMFPMICYEAEIIEAKRICDEVKEKLIQDGIPFADSVKVGIMIETPAAAIMSDILAEQVDFFSIGTNDLTQYTLAADRQNAEVSKYYNPHHPSVLRMLKMVAENAHQNGIPVGICGELANDAELLDYYLKIGIDELSINPSNVLPLRKRISEI